MFNFKLAEKEIHKREESKKELNETLLIVDDEMQNLDAISRVLEDFYTIITAENGKEGLKCLKENPDVKVLLTDHKMPLMTGAQLCIEAKKMQHQATRVLLTGFSEMESLIELVNNESVFRYLTKPIDNAGLRTAITQAMLNFEQREENRRLIKMVKSLLEEKGQLLKKVKSLGGDSQQSTENTNFLDKPKRIPLTTLFMDLRGFTKFCEGKAPSDILKVLQTIFVNIHEAIYRHGGIVDKHLGDGLMAVFGLGESTGINSAIACVEEIVSRAPNVLKGLPIIKPGEIKISLGFASGEVILGLLGTDNRSELAIIGQPANLASRLQEFTKYFFYKEYCLVGVL